MLLELIKKNRSYRRFDESYELPKELLIDFIELARLSASARNAQSLKYFISTFKKTNDLIFPHLSWAGYLKDWPGPSIGERPTGYIVMLNDTAITENFFCDDGIAAQSILLGAVEQGLGGCIIGSVNRNKLHETLNLPSHLHIIHVIALGKPQEEVKLEEMNKGDIHYWRDNKGVHHVPKRSISEIVINK